LRKILNLAATVSTAFVYFKGCVQALARTQGKRPIKGIIPQAMANQPKALGMLTRGQDLDRPGSVPFVQLIGDTAQSAGPRNPETAVTGFCLRRTLATAEIAWIAKIIWARQ
jgi:hypothetical protein